MSSPKAFMTVSITVATKKAVSIHKVKNILGPVLTKQCQYYCFVLFCFPASGFCLFKDINKQTKPTKQTNNTSKP